MLILITLLLPTSTELLSGVNPPAAAETQAVNIQFLPPGCPLFGRSDVGTPSVVFEALAQRDAGSGALELGDGVLYDGVRWFFPRHNLNRHGLTRALIAQPHAFERVVLSYDLPVLAGTYEVAFQYPLGGPDWVDEVEKVSGPRSRLPSMRKTRMRLVQYRHRREGFRILALEPSELEESTPIDTDLLRYTPSQGARLRIESPTGDSTWISLARVVGRGSRTAHELQDLTRRHGDALRTHAGSVVDRFMSPEVRRYCANALSQFAIAALIPGGGELGLGPEKLREFGAEHGLPYVAANLRRTSDDDAPFPPYVLTHIGARSVAFIGLVHDDQLRDLPVPVQDEWVLEPERAVLERTLARLHSELGRRPDFTVVLVDGVLDLKTFDGVPVDAVIGDFSIDDHRWFKTETHLRPRSSGITDSSRFEIPAVTVRAARHSVGLLTAHFAFRAKLAPWRLTSIEVESYAVLDDGPREMETESQLRALEEEVLDKASQVVLADPAPLVEADPSLESLVYGPRVPIQHRFVNYSENSPAVFTDPLWMRLVTNAMLRQLETEVVLSRNLRRTTLTAGRVQRRYVDDWLRSSDVVLVCNLTGADVRKIAARLKMQVAYGPIPVEDFVYAAGLNPQTGQVRGRPIDPQKRYRVALTDATIRLFADIDFAGYQVFDRFVIRNEGAFAEPEGQPLLLRELVLRDIEKRSAGKNPVTQRLYLEDTIQDFSGQRDIHWSGRVDEISVRGSRYLNNGSVRPLASSLQTRLTTLDNYNFDLKTRLRGSFEAPDFAWDNRLRAELSQWVFDSSEGSDRQEPSDDLVLTSELRFSAFEVNIVKAGSITPFVQGVLDSEFTPTENPTTGDDNPRQMLLRALLGLVAEPGAILREVRLGTVIERDTVNDISDIGFQASYELRWPLPEKLTWESTFETRYFLPNRADDESTLGLIVQAVNRMLVPVGGWFDLFFYVDLYAARGKTNTTDAIGVSWDFGAGVDVARLFARSRARSVGTFDRLLR